MQSTDLLLRVYETALEKFKSIDASIEDQLKRLMVALRQGGKPATVEVAFLEGLRRERDAALAELREAEHQLFDYLLTKLGPARQATD